MTDAPPMSALLTDLIVAGENVLMRRNAHNGLDALEARLEEHLRSPRSVGVLDEKEKIFLAVLRLIERARKNEDARAMKAWSQVAGVLLPEIRDDLFRAIMAEAGR